MNQLELHKKIEEFFKSGVESADIKAAQSFLINEDAKRFFFSQATESWLNWMWNNGFLDNLKKKAEDLTRYSYRMPELEYLTRVSEKDPTGVTQVINSIKISEENFNPEVIDRFLWIISALPSDQIKILTGKILDEKWIYLMRIFRKNGYEFEKIIDKLIESNGSSSLLELAQAMLIIKNKSEVKEKETSFNVDNPFYLSDLDGSGIFEALANIDEAYIEQVFKFTTTVMAEIVKLAEIDQTGIFQYEDMFSLYDVDFFTLEIENKRNRSYREDVKNLAATIKKLIERTIGKKCEEQSDEPRRFFQYIEGIPLSRSIWRLRLFALAQCVTFFKEELKKAFFKVFDVGERYFEIEGGAEYHQALIRGFKVLDNADQREYVRKIFDYFDEALQDEDVKSWRKRDGIQILSLIKEYLTLDEKEVIKKRFGISVDQTSYVPEPTISKVTGGMVHHRSPGDVAVLTIGQIITNLKSEWSAEKIKEEDDGDFLNRRSVEGLGEALKEDVKKRIDVYLENIKDFFNRESIHPHYLYSLLYGIEEMLRNKKLLTIIQIKQLFALFLTIKGEGLKTPFKRKDDKSWLSDWIGVHKAIADLLILIIENKDLKENVHSDNREDIKNIIAYLITIKDSPSKEQEKPDSGDLHHVVINSVRGRAFETFVVFTENDGKTLAQDVKELYQEFLKDDSLAVRFAIGRYLASFYFRDKEFITSLFPQIFPKDESPKKDIYLAAWEGYLSNTLYDKLFVALTDYYDHAIKFNPAEYTNRKYIKGLDESLAVHLALAFLHLGLTQEDKLFQLFWGTVNVTRHKEFVSFIGRHVLTRDFIDDKWFEESKVSKEKLVIFWQWLLDNQKIKDPAIFSGFGFWINSNKEVIDDLIVAEKMVKTLQKSDGNIDWDYGLLNRLEIFAEKSPDNTIKIIRNYLLDIEGNLNPHHPSRFIRSEEIKNALKIIYKNNIEKKQEVIDLINILIEKGSNAFWGLKEVLNESISE